MADVASIAPAGKMPDPLEGATPMADPLAGAKPLAASGGPAGSVFESTGQKLKRFGKKAAEVGVGAAIPIAAGVATEGASLPIELGASALSGAAVPYAEYGTAKVLGDNPEMPKLRDAAKSAGWNLGFSALGAAGKMLQGDAAAVAPEMARTEKTSANLKQAINNRNFWKGMGLSDEQVDRVLKDPSLQADTLRAAEGAKKYGQAVTDVFTHARGQFKARYDDAFGGLGEKPVADTNDLGTAFNRAGQPGSERELSPGFAKWLSSKEDELFKAGKTPTISDQDAIKIAFGDKQAAKMSNAAGTPIYEANVAQARKMIDQGNQAGKPLEGTPKATPPLSIQDLRDMRTELRENLPSNPTPLEKKVSAQLTDAITQKYESTLKENGATAEQIGRLRGIDEDYARFSGTVRALDPRDPTKFGKQIADGLFDPMLKEPEYAANFMNMAKAAEEASPGQVMQPLREAFLEKAQAEATQGGGPMNEMKALQALQKQWGNDKNTRAVLKELFPDSPMNDPITFSKVIGQPVNGEKVKQAGEDLSRAASSPYIIRAMALTAIAGGSIYQGAKHPEQIPYIIAALASLKFGGQILGKVSSATDRAWVNFRLDPTANTFKNFMQTSGAMIGATTSVPSDQR